MSSKLALVLRRSALVALVALASPLRAAADDAGTRAEALLRRARAEYRAARFDGAQAALVEAIAICDREGCPPSTEARIFVGLGSLAHRAGDLLRARVAFDHALSVDPNARADRALSDAAARAAFADSLAGRRLDDTDDAGAAPAEDPPGADAPPGNDAPEDVGPDEPADAAPRGWRGHVFVEAGYGLAGATVGRGMEAASRPSGIAPGADPQTDADPTNDAYDLAGTFGCDAPAGTYCVRVTDPGLAFAHGVHLGAGAFVTERVGLSLRVRIAPSAGGGALAHVLLGARVHVSLLDDARGGLGVALFGGPVVGQIQLRPKQQVTPGANDVERPFVRTGPAGAEVGAAITYAITDALGVFASPSLYVLAPRLSAGAELDVGLVARFLRSP